MKMNGHAAPQVLASPQVLAAPLPQEGLSADRAAAGHSIGEIISKLRGLSDRQLAEIVMHQRQSGLRFGESAVALQLVSSNDVLWALSQQFEYAYKSLPGRSSSAELIMANAPFSEEAEAFRDLRAQLMLDGRRARRPIAVTSPNAGDGKSYVAANLAVAFSQLGARTLLIDADLRAPRQHGIFDVPGRAGLSDVLAARSTNDVLQQIPELPDLYLLPAGTVPPNPLELLQRSAFSLQLNTLLDCFDHIVVDTSAFRRGADARVVAATCGASIAVGKPGHTRLSTMQKMISALGQSHVHMFGIVMNERHDQGLVKRTR